MEKLQKFSIVNVANNQLPLITEDIKTRYNWIPFGVYGHDDFFDAVADKAIEMNTGARGLKSIMETVLLRWQFNASLMKENGVQKLMFSADTVVNNSEPKLVLEKPTKKAR